jgi:hypothetical protein
MIMQRTPSFSYKKNPQENIILRIISMNDLVQGK